jgi:ribosomal protein S18 acetylase RimI-like enzyme
MKSAQRNSFFTGMFPGFTNGSSLRLNMADENSRIMGQKMADLLIRPYMKNDEKEVVALWDICGLVVPWNNPNQDIERKLKVNPELFLVGTLEGKIAATCMAGYEGHRGWINYLAVSPNLRRKGIGAVMMAEAEKKLKAVGCPKINLQIRTSNQDVVKFYESIGYKDDCVVSMGKRLEVDKTPST